MPYFGLVADEDLSEKQFHAVKLVGGAAKDFRIGLCDATGDDDLCIGILLDKPESGQPATVAHVGDMFVKAKLSGTVAAGDRLKADTSSGKEGQLIKTTTENDIVIAISPVNAVDGEITNVFLVGPYSYQG